MIQASWTVTGPLLASPALGSAVPRKVENEVAHTGSLTAVIIAFSMTHGCAPGPTATRVGVEVATLSSAVVEAHNPTGFVPKTTALTATDPAALIVAVASEDSLLAKRVVGLPEPQVVYQYAVGTRTMRLYPRELSDLLDQASFAGPLPTDVQLFELGTFQKKLPIGVFANEFGYETPTQNLSWGHISDPGKKQVLDALEAMRDVGAKHGGNAIVGLSLFRVFDPAPAAYLSGTLVAFETLGDATSDPHDHARASAR